MEKSDRRVRRTALLRHGLAQLMTEKSANEVTVKELVELVDLKSFLPSICNLSHRHLQHAGKRWRM